MAVVLVTGGFDQKIRYWEATSGICTKTLRFGESQINKLQISRDKVLVAAGGNPNIHIYDVNSNHDNPLLNCESHSQNVTELGFQRDGKWLYSCSEDGMIKVWDLRTAACQVNIDTRCAINAGALHPTEAAVLTGDHSGCMKVWDLRTCSCRYEHNPLPEVPIRTLSVSRDAKMLAVGSHTGNVYMYKSAGQDHKDEWQLESEFVAHDNYILKCVISPDMSSLATTSADHTIKLWRMEEPWGEQTRCLTHHQRWVWDAVFSADSSYMVSASSDQSAKLWDLRSGEVIRNYLGHSLAVTCVALNDSNLD
mmetsp:Transcript_16686/g.25086  ORF Transcript_16686/g.25086 Transcript_16686/m.25086 type:complete len:308 (-) Transcript_16686:42-965(-)